MRHHLRFARVALVAAVSAALVFAAASSARTESSVDEPTAFWVTLREKADLDEAARIRDRTERGRFVHERLRSVADRSQAGLRALLRRRGADFRSFWIANTIKVEGDAALADELARRPEVERIVADGTYRVPRPEPAGSVASVDGVEWNIAHVGAPQVWSTFGVRGEGIVVGSIDTGVEFDHPALGAQYRGRGGDGSFDHNYNWFDPSSVCGSPSLAPCDNNGHGTHTTGTVVGDDGDPGENRIGIAPHARWIAAKGCEQFTCSYEALFASGQWMLAPTDLNGENPRPDLRPHVVNNSWGDDDGTNPFFRDIVQAWVASGIFPVFANGNAGSRGCDTVGSPASFPDSYGVGAHDADNAIAFFSSRGRSPFDGITKPNIAAPGMNIRSSLPGGGYSSSEGTSMATPHVTGTVALMWSAAPAIAGDVAATRAVLARTAIDTSDLTCGGTPENNNVWGEGRLDAFAAVDQSPRATTGMLTGTVTDESTGAALGGATIRAEGPGSRSTTSDPAGRFVLTLEAGSYDVSVAAFGYLTEQVTVAVARGETTVHDPSLLRAASHALTGRVRDTDGNPLVGAHVTILDTPIAPATTGADGSYSFANVPVGEYDVEADAGGCNAPQTRHIAIDGGTTLDFALADRVDSFGYSCETSEAVWVDANNVVPPTYDSEDGAFEAELPFPFELYGRTYESVHVYTNGLLEFLGRTDPAESWRNGPIPAIEQPNAAVYPFWDDLHIDSAASIRTELIGRRPNRRFVIEWRNAHPRVALNPQPEPRIDFEVVLHEDGRILMQYRNIDEAEDRERGSSATIGIENESGTVAFQYSLNERSIRDGLAVLYNLPPSGFVEGRVVEPNAGPVAGATVTAIAGGTAVRDTTTDARGFYRLRAPLGSYELEASKEHYSTARARVVLDEEGETVSRDFSIRTAHASVSPATLELSLPRNTTATRTLRLVNNGSAAMAWRLEELEGRESGANPGDLIASWPATGADGAWGVGYAGNVWISDVVLRRNVEFTADGAPTGRSHDAPWSADDGFPADMAFDTRHDCMAQVNFGGDNGIYCWSIEDGSVRYSINGSFPWTAVPQLGLAYRPDDDTFYIGGWNSRELFSVKGNSHPDSGAVVSRCSPADSSIAGIAWNAWFEVLWVAINGEPDKIHRLDPETCAVLDTLQTPTAENGAGGLDLGRGGDLLLVDLGTVPGTVHVIETGIPAFRDVPWLSADPASGALAQRATQLITVRVDTTGLAPGVYHASVYVLSNSGRRPSLPVPVTLTVRE